MINFVFIVKFLREPNIKYSHPCTAQNWMQPYSKKNIFFLNTQEIIIIKHTKKC